MLTLADEMWNINNPRPFPKRHYHMLQWEQADFVELKNGDWVLRPKRKVDSELKKAIREKYYVLQYKQRKQLNSKKK